MAKVISQLPSGGSVPKHNNLLGLNEEDYIHLTQFEKAKLDGIQSGAEVNVNADWNAISGDAQILNKPASFPPSTHTHTKSQITDFAHTHPISDVTGLPMALNDLQLNKEDKANKNIANGYAGLDSSGKINPIQLPALAITDTFVVASQAEQLALVAEVGDVAVRTDLNKSFILRVTGASTLANWQELLTSVSVDQTIIDGSTNAVSGNAVFDALATKAPISSIHNPVTIGTANGLSLSTQQISLGLASSGVTGALSGTDWNTFNNKVGGSGSTNFLTKWSGTNTVNASGAWRETSNRLANEADNGSSEFQVTGQIDLKSKNTQGDGGQLGAELLTTGSSDASWTGTSFATGYTHVAGSATTLTSTLAPVINNLYQLAYTVTGRTAGSFTIAFGGTTTSGITSTGAVGHRTSSTGALVITPTSDFNGTIVVSIKQITAGAASFVFRDNSGTIRNELRILGSNNTANGVYSLQYNTTGTSNTAIGTGSLLNNTTGGANTAIGVYSLLSNTTGTNNTANGVGSLQSNTTGNSNTANGVYSLQYNTTGTSNTANGVNAGRFIANGTTPLTVVNSSTFLGFNTKSLADNSTNETVVGYNAIGDGNNTVSIGNTSVISSRLRGRILQGNVVDNLIDSGQFSGNVLATGFKTASGTASQFLKANGSVDSNTYVTSASLPTVDQTIIDGSTNAVSGNAVFDGLDTKFPTPTGLTTNYLPKWNGSGFGNSNVIENSGRTLFNTTIDNGVDQVQVNGSGSFVGSATIVNGAFSTPASTGSNLYLTANGADKKIFFGDGTGYNLSFIKKNAGIETVVARINDLGNAIEVNGTISASPATTANQVPTWGQVQAAASSGRYTPTGNVITGATSVSVQSHTYIKIGNIVTVYGESLPTGIVTGVTVIYEISLPIARANTTTKALGFGSLNVAGGSTNNPVRLESSSATTVRISFNAGVGGTPSVLYSLQYDITQ